MKGSRSSRSADTVWFVGRRTSHQRTSAVGVFVAVLSLAEGGVEEAAGLPGWLVGGDVVPDDVFDFALRTQPLQGHDDDVLIQRPTITNSV